MDAAGIDVQILSHSSPGPEALEPSLAVDLARQANDVVADTVSRYPERFPGFATLPMLNPAAAASELERLVRDQGFAGALINGHVNGRYLDDRFFWPVFECAETLDVPIYLHPVLPPTFQPGASGGLKRTIEEYLRENFYGGILAGDFANQESGAVDSSWSLSYNAYLGMVHVIGIDRVLFTTDYPYANMKAARQFLDQMPINPIDKEKIAHLNAERLLRL